MKRPTRIIAFCGLVFLSVGLTVMVTLTMRGFLAFQDAESQRYPGIVHAEDIGDTKIIYGRLNRPIGEEMKIHGTVIHNNLNVVTFQVDSVDGKKMNGPQIPLLGANRLPEGTMATIRGKEMCQIGVRYPGDSAAPADSSGNDRQFSSSAFKATEVIEPKEYALEKE
jgi:hypothetical protein